MAMRWDFSFGSKTSWWSAVRGTRGVGIIMYQNGETRHEAGFAIIYLFK